MTLSSTSLGYLTKHCPKALRDHLAGVPCDRTVFQVGVAAHAVLEECGKRGAKEWADVVAVADAVVEELCAVGRSYFGQPEPPMNPEQAFQGRTLALDYLARHELPGGEFETCLYSKQLGPDGKPALRALIDQTYDEERGDEEFGGLCLCVRDYKSAWTADSSELETLQRKIQAVLAWRSLVRPDHLGLVLEIANLRSGATHERVVWLDEEGEALLTQWEEEILQLARIALKAIESGAASPGAGCMGCPFLLGCKEGRASMTPGETTESLAVAFIVAGQVRAECAARLKGFLAGRGPMEVHGGTVGFQAKVKRKAVERAPLLVLREWYESVGRVFEDDDDLEMKHAAELGLLQTIGLGATSIENIGKKLWPERRDVPHRKEWIAGLLEDVVTVEFGEVKS